MLLREPDCVISSSTSDFQSLAGSNRRGGHSLNQVEVRLADVPRGGAFFIVFIETIFDAHNRLSTCRKFSNGESPLAIPSSEILTPNRQTALPWMIAKGRYAHTQTHSRNNHRRHRRL